MTPNLIMKSRKLETAAQRMGEWLRTKAIELGQDQNNVRIDGAVVCWEQGPYAWAEMINGGHGIHDGPSFALPSTGPFPDGVQNDRWYCELENPFTLRFVRK